MTKIYYLMILFIITLLGCNTDARVASKNLSKAAEMFEINRRIVFYNGITDAYMLVVEGRCSISIDKHERQLELTCKTSPTSYKKHYLGLSDNVTYFDEQLNPIDVSVYNYRVIFKPQAIIPDIDLEIK